MDGNNGVDYPKKRMPIRVYPRYVRLRQGSEIRYSLKLLRPISKVQTRHHPLRTCSIGCHSVTLALSLLLLSD